MSETITKREYFLRSGEIYIFKGSLTITKLKEFYKFFKFSFSSLLLRIKLFLHDWKLRSFFCISILGRSPILNCKVKIWYCKVNIEITKEVIQPHVFLLSWWERAGKYLAVIVKKEIMHHSIIFHLFISCSCLAGNVCII